MVGAPPKKAHYANLRVEMWDDGIRNWLIQGGALPDNVPGLLEDLIGPHFRPSSQTGKLAMETADQIKARGLPSPDLGMALAFTFAADVSPRGGDDRATEALRPGGQGGGPRMAVMDKDPLDSVRREVFGP